MTNSYALFKEIAAISRATQPALCNPESVEATAKMKQTAATSFGEV